MRITAAQPYPLDCEDAAAIEAAIARQVQAWETLLSCDLSDWLSKTSDPTDDGVKVLENAVRALIKAGQLKAGAAVELGSIPMESLLLAPLIDGEWIDRHVVELAEFGALLEASGFALRVSADPHYLAPPRICRIGQEDNL